MWRLVMASELAYKDLSALPEQGRPTALLHIQKPLAVIVLSVGIQRPCQFLLCEIHGAVTICIIINMVGKLATLLWIFEFLAGIINDEYPVKFFAGVG